MSTDNVPLTVVEASEEERREAMPVPDGRPYMVKTVEPHDCNVVCGKCLRVVGQGVTLLDFWEHFTTPDKRRLMLCTCGSYLEVPSRPGSGPQPWREALKGGKRKSPPPSNA